MSIGEFCPLSQEKKIQKKSQFSFFSNLISSLITSSYKRVRLPYSRGCNKLEIVLLVLDLIQLPKVKYAHYPILMLFFIFPSFQQIYQRGHLSPQLLPQIPSKGKIKTSYDDHMTMVNGVTKSPTRAQQPGET